MSQSLTTSALPEPAEPFQEGFDVKTILAALFIGFIMLPGSIYMGLVTGQGVAGAAEWVTIILFVEIAKRSFVQLRRQEIYIIFIVAAGLAAQTIPGLALYGGAFGVKIWDQYLIQSPEAKAFELVNLIPNWVVPAPNSPALLERTFVHRDWLIPLAILLVQQVLYRLNFFGLGYCLFRLTRDIERLPFPMAPVNVGGATALAEASGKTESWRWRLFTIGAMIGLLFGIFYVAIPVFTGLWMTQPLMLIKIPFIDGTPKIGTKLPAATFGVFTDLSHLFAGFILPFWVCVGSFIAAMGARMVANPILHSHGLLPSWQPGSGVIPTTVANNLDFWLSITIGVGIVVALIGLGTVVVLSLKSRSGKRESAAIPAGRGDFSLVLALTMWVGSTLLLVMLSHRLVQRFPLWIFLLFGFVLTPMLSYISARMFGITGVHTGVSFPMVIEGSYILSGYKGADIWFAPVPYWDHGYVTQRFVELELNRTRFTSWFKAELTVFLIMIVCSFLFWSIIWKLGPIPSSSYPFVQKMWPLHATFRCLWVSSTVPGGANWMLHALKPHLMLYGGLGAGALFALISAFRLPTSLFYGMVGGINMWPHHVLPLMTGALLSRYYFAPKFGEKTWRSYAPVLLAGYACGMGLIGMVAVAVTLIGKSVSQIIF